MVSLMNRQGNISECFDELEDLNMTAATAPTAVAFNQAPFLYINGMSISNNATTPNTKVDVGAGMCRDNSDVFYMNLGNFNGFLNGSITANSSTTIDATVN